MTGPHRVALLAHGIPALSPGGAEVAAQTLHQALRRRDDVVSRLYACVPASHPLAGTENEEAGNAFLPEADLDPFRLVNCDPLETRLLVERLRSFRPDTIHLHHVLGFGADALFALREAFPAAAILLTLHEFLPICHHQGQMVRPNTGALCESAAPSACARCFPALSPARFLLREHVLKAYFAVCDGFLAPSRFLAARYREWGLSGVEVMENAVAARPAVVAEPREARTRFGFFGQINPFKGVDLLLDAFAGLPDGAASLSIHGDHLHRQTPEFQARIAEKLARAGSSVAFHGGYRGEDLPALMAGVDFVVVPSLWWENSPLVIQEAFRAGRPVIASAIGGMAEKVRHGIDGLLFEAGDAASLKEALARALQPGRWEAMAGAVRPPEAPERAAERHLQVYRGLHVRPVTA